MELKTIKEFCHKNNLGEGLEYVNGLFKVNIDSKLATKADKSEITKVYKVKGSANVSTINNLTPEVGWVYNLIDSGTIINGLTGEVPVDAGDNVVYTDSGWDKLSAATKIALEAGENISIEDNVISALGYTYDTEKNSFAVGSGSATGQYSYAEGSGAKAEEYCSHAEGLYTFSSGNASHAEGSYTTASGYNSHAEGSGSIASGQYSHAEGSGTTGTGYASHAEGSSTVASGDCAHTEGSGTIASGHCSHAEGNYTITSNSAEHAEGQYNKSNKNNEAYGNPLNTQHSIGIGTSEEARKNAQEVMQNGDHYIIGIGNYDGTNINEEGVKTLQEVLEDISSASGGGETYTAGDNISIEGNVISAVGYTYDKEKEAFSTGSGSATGEKSYAEGGETEAVGAYSHAEGRFTVASGLCSHAEGSETNATSTGAHAEGCFTSASYASHAEGYGTSANGRESHAEGSYTEANNPSEHAEGSYNISNKNSGDFRDPLNTIHSIGIGYVNKSTLKPIRKNAWEVMLNGDAYLINVGGYKGKNPAEAQTLQEVINFKVDKEEGKSLSTNDYTTEEKTKLEGIEEGALVNTVVSVNGQVGEVVISELTAGTNVDITDNTISALGYEFDNELNSVKVGRKLTTEELEEIFGASGATFAAGNTSISTAWENGTFSWVKDTNIIQVTDTSLSLPGVIFKVTTNDDSILCCIVDRDLSNSQLIVDKDIPFDYIENVSTIDTIIGIAYGKASIAGQATSASGNLAHSEGFGTFAHGMSSHSEGIMNWTLGDGSHAEGGGNVAYELGSHAEGMITKAYGVGSHTEGILTIATHEAEHAEGKYNVSNTTDWAGNTIHSIGIGTNNDNRKNALEVTTQGAVYMKDVGGYDGTTLAECYPVLLVINALLDSKNNDIPAINKRIDDLNIPTLPENIVNTVNGQTGDVTIDTSGFATTEEVQAVNTRIDELNIPADLSNVVTKTDDHQLTLGTDNNSTHEKTLLVGTGLTTSNNESLVVGAYNNSEYFASWGVDAPAIQVGAGTEDSKRTVMVVQKNGKSLGLLGFEQNGFGDFAEYFEWADGNPEGEDRVGYMVLLNEDKIELAESLDNCIGIITGTGAFVADAACLDWHGRYLKDKWGRNIYELTGVLAENPDYDPTKEYIPREYRKEWSPVGLVGKVHVRQDGTLKPNGFVGCVNGIATNVDKSSWRVLKVINEEIALILIR